MKRSEVDRSKLSPMMKHYVELKDKYEDTIILYRLGDFYEMFFEDAEVVAHALELTLTGKSAGLDERVPMCGIPHHASEVYIDRLIKNGFKVAICEQVEDPKESKGIVRREVTEVISSGTIINANSLNEKENNYIGMLYDFEYGFVITYVDITTGEIYSEILERNINDIVYKIMSLEIKELVVTSNTDKELISKIKSSKVPITYNDEYLDSDGFVIDSILSEHVCQGLLEGYILTGRHGFFTSYEAFIRIVDSMASQHAKWLKVCKQLPWRQKISSLNYVLTSHVWQQDHNGYTHQDPGFLNHLVTKKADIVRIYLPPDANCLLSCFEHCIKSKDYINVMVASKHPRTQWLSMDEAVIHCTQGIGIWKWASNDEGDEPDLVMASCGDTPTMESLAAVSILREHFPELKIRVVNVVDLMKLQSDKEHPHGLSDEDYDAIFTKDKPIIFAFHGYPHLIHQLAYNRHNNDLHVHGYNEEGTITTRFDMCVQNKIDRYHLVLAALKRLPQLGNRGSSLNQLCKDKLVIHKQYIYEHGEDMPEIKNWKWEDK